MKFKKGDKVIVTGIGKGKMGNNGGYYDGDTGIVVEANSGFVSVNFDNPDKFNGYNRISYYVEYYELEKWCEGYQSPLWKVLNGESV